VRVIIVALPGSDEFQISTPVSNQSYFGPPFNLYIIAHGRPSPTSPLALMPAVAIRCDFVTENPSMLSGGLSRRMSYNPGTNP
jgi:hypothetical protein